MYVLVHHDSNLNVLLILLLAVPCWPACSFKFKLLIHSARNTTRSSTNKFIHLPLPFLLLDDAAAGAAAAAAAAAAGAALASAASSASASAAAPRRGRRGRRGRRLAGVEGRGGVGVGRRRVFRRVALLGDVLELAFEL